MGFENSNPCKIKFETRRSTGIVEALLKDEVVELIWTSESPYLGEMTAIVKLPHHKSYYMTKAAREYGRYDRFTILRALVPIKLAKNHFGIDSPEEWTLKDNDTILVWSLEDLDFEI